MRIYILNVYLIIYTCTEDIVLLKDTSALVMEKLDRHSGGKSLDPSITKLPPLPLPPVRVSRERYNVLKALLGCAGPAKLKYLVRESVRGVLRGGYLAGRVKQNIAPRAGWFETHKRPPCEAMIERVIESPSPSPCGLVVKNGSNRRSRSGAGTPGPLSLTQTCTMPSAVDSLCTLSLRSEGGTAFIASQALWIRLSSTCWS